MIAALALALLVGAVSPACAAGVAPTRSPAAAALAAAADSSGARRAPADSVITAGPDSATAVARSPLVGLAFLAGDWVAVGSPDSTGGSVFEWMAGARAMLRRNWADTPGGHHEDVMLVFPAAGGGGRAIYVDNEGHTIEYGLTVSPGRAVFESAGPGPRYRLTYRARPDSTLSGLFEIAPPGGPYKTYLEWTARRR